MLYQNKKPRFTYSLRKGQAKQDFSHQQKKEKRKKQHLTQPNTFTRSIKWL